MYIRMYIISIFLLDPECSISSSGHYDYDVSDFAVASPDFTVGTGSAEGN